MFCANTNLQEGMSNKKARVMASAAVTTKNLNLPCVSATRKNAQSGWMDDLVTLRTATYEISERHYCP